MASSCSTVLLAVGICCTNVDKTEDIEYHSDFLGMQILKKAIEVYLLLPRLDEATQEATFPSK